MIEITNGFTSISAGSDSMEVKAQDGSYGPRDRHAKRSPTGARVTVEFNRDAPLASGQMVKVRYDFMGNGALREGTGIARPTRTFVRWGHGAHYGYRMSYWIDPRALMNVIAGDVRYRTERGPNVQPTIPDGRRVYGQAAV